MNATYAAKTVAGCTAIPPPPPRARLLQRGFLALTGLRPKIEAKPARFRAFQPCFPVSKTAASHSKDVVFLSYMTIFFPHFSLCFYGFSAAAKDNVFLCRAEDGVKEVI